MLSANAINLDQSKQLLFGKELNCYLLTNNIHFIDITTIKPSQNNPVENRKNFGKYWLQAFLLSDNFERGPQRI